MRRPSKLTDYQSLLMYYESLGKYGYRRVGDKCFEEIQNSNGEKTHAFKEKCSIQQFIQMKCQKETN